MAETRDQAVLSKFAPIDFREQTVLDFGCSHGGSVVYFAEQGAAHVIGVDVGEWQLRMAEAYLECANSDGCLPVEVRPTTATHYRDLGFNQMTVRRFLKLLRRSGLVAEMMRMRPVAGLRPLTWLPGVRELLVTEVHCVLRPA